MPTPDDTEDTIAIINDLNDLARLNPREQLNAIRDDHTWTSIPGTHGGHHPLRTPGAKALTRLTKRLIKNQEQPLDYDPNSVATHLAQSFSTTYLAEGQTVTKESITSMLTRAINAVRAAHESITHHVPCIAMHATNPDHVRLGPVHFSTSKRFLREHQDTIEEYRARERSTLITHVGKPHLKTADDAIRLADSIVDETNRFYADHNWVATITIPACHERISSGRAERTVQAALDILKLIFGHDARHARTGSARQLPHRTSAWTTTPRGLETSMTGQGESILGTEGWYAEIGPTGRYYLHLAGIPLTMLTNPSKACDVGTRYLDALHWYGEAISEPLPGPASVKYAAALERLTITPDLRTNLPSHVTRRSGIIAAAGNPAIGRATRKAVDALYDERSEYLHGRRSPHDQPHANYATTVTTVIFRYLKLARTLTRKGTTSDDDLAREYQRLEHNPDKPSSR